MKLPLITLICILWLSPALAQSPFAPPKPKETKPDTFVAPQIPVPQPPKQKMLGVINGKKMCEDLLTGQIVPCAAEPGATSDPILPLSGTLGAATPTKHGRNPAMPITLPQTPPPPPAQPAPDLNKIKAEARAEVKAELAAAARDQASKETSKEVAKSNAQIAELEKKASEANARAQSFESKVAALTKQIESKNQEYQAQKAHIEALQKDLSKMRDAQDKAPPPRSPRHDFSPCQNVGRSPCG